MPLSSYKPLVIGITLGDPAGIGPEVVKKALAHADLPQGVVFRVLGETKGKGVTLGKSTCHSAKLALEALENGVALWKKGEIAALVTAPVQKETLHEVGFSYPGQTEFFAEACGKSVKDSVMILTCPRLTVSVCSTHCSLQEAVSRLSIDTIQHVTEKTASFLKARGLKHPTIALAGVNPHAGENGLFGEEEQRIILPAKEALCQAGWQVIGPCSPDTVFYRALQGEFDAVIGMYHDQGLIPFKLLSFPGGVNVTWGLPLLRTSPAHGTALDLAGKDQANEQSMLEAISLACRLVKKKQPPL